MFYFNFLFLSIFTLFSLWFSVSSFREKEVRAGVLGLLLSVLLVAALGLYGWAYSSDLISGALMFTGQIAAAVVMSLFTLSMFLPIGRRPEALAGTKGMKVSEGERFNQKDTAFNIAHVGGYGPDVGKEKMGPPKHGSLQRYLLDPLHGVEGPGGRQNQSHKEDRLQAGRDHQRNKRGVEVRRCRSRWDHHRQAGIHLSGELLLREVTTGDRAGGNDACGAEPQVCDRIRKGDVFRPHSEDAHGEERTKPGRNRKDLFRACPDRLRRGRLYPGPRLLREGAPHQKRATLPRSPCSRCRARRARQAQLPHHRKIRTPGTSCLRDDRPRTRGGQTRRHGCSGFLRELQAL